MISTRRAGLRKIASSGSTPSALIGNRRPDSPHGRFDSMTSSDTRQGTVTAVPPGRKSWAIGCTTKGVNTSWASYHRTTSIFSMTSALTGRCREGTGQTKRKESSKGQGRQTLLHARGSSRGRERRGLSRKCGVNQMRQK